MDTMHCDIENISRIENPLHKSIFQKAEPFLRTRHNIVHTLISHDYALYLLSVEGGEPSVVLPAILLHDVGWSTISEDRQLLAFGPVIKEPALGRQHEIEGAKMAKTILSELKYPEELIRKIELIIDGHDSRGKAIDIDDSIVKDSDKLFRFSQTGFGIYFRLFHFEPASYLVWLSKVAESWFFTHSAHRLACQEIEKRKGDLDTNLYYAPDWPYS